MLWVILDVWLLPMCNKPMITTQLISKCCMNPTSSYEIKVTKPQLQLERICKGHIYNLLKMLYWLVLSIDFCDDLNRKLNELLYLF